MSLGRRENKDKYHRHGRRKVIRVRVWVKNQKKKQQIHTRVNRRVSTNVFDAIPTTACLQRFADLMDIITRFYAVSGRAHTRRGFLGEFEFIHWGKTNERTNKYARISFIRAVGPVYDFVFTVSVDVQYSARRVHDGGRTKCHIPQPHTLS